MALNISLVILTTVLTSVLGASIPTVYNHRIVGGKETTIEEFPFQASIHIGFGHKCGGVIISEYHVLTAGHCYLAYYDLSAYHVYAGMTNQSDCQPQYHYGVKSMVVHPKFAITQMETFYDISIITLKTKIEFGLNVRSIPLPEAGYYPAPGTQAVVSGWGLLWTNGPLSNQLQMLKLEITDYDICVDKYISKLQIVGTEMVCAGGIDGQDSCFGDSGGPLIADGKLIGLVAFGDNDYCALPNYPGVYTNIGSVRDFIKEQTNL